MREVCVCVCARARVIYTIYLSKYSYSHFTNRRFVHFFRNGRLVLGKCLIPDGVGSVLTFFLSAIQALK